MQSKRFLFKLSNSISFTKSIVIMRSQLSRTWGPRPKTWRPRPYDFIKCPRGAARPSRPWPRGLHQWELWPLIVVIGGRSCNAWLSELHTSPSGSLYRGLIALLKSGFVSCNYTADHRTKSAKTCYKLNWSNSPLTAFQVYWVLCLESCPLMYCILFL